MRAFVLGLLLVPQISFPLPNGRSDTHPAPGAPRLPDQSTIQGEVKTKEGEPIPLANVSVRTQQDLTGADQRGGGAGWPGSVVKARHDGTFRVYVPGGTTYEVCAEVPTKSRQCRLVAVSTNDVEMLLFEF